MGQKRTCQRAVELVRFVPIQHRRGSNSGAFREIVGVRRSTGPGIAVHGPDIAVHPAVRG
jgi:hypothetical protein